MCFQLSINHRYSNRKREKNKTFTKHTVDASIKANVKCASEEIIEYDENNIDGKSDFEHDSLFFQTNEHNSNRSNRKFEYAKKDV